MAVGQIELLLFPADVADVTAESVADGVVIDCETSDKHERQIGYDTQINACRPEDVAIVRRYCPETRIICRVNNRPGRLADEVARAIAAGADEVIVPMVESMAAVQAAFEAASGRAGVGVMIETEWAVARARDLARLPLSRVFVGLHDLAIQRRSRHLFENVVNGTVAELRGHFRDVRFGFGGLTLPDGGRPIPCRLLMAELSRLDTDFTFLRRSFLHDAPAAGLDHAAAVRLIKDAWRDMRARPPQAVQADHEAFTRAVEAVLMTADRS